MRRHSSFSKTAVTPPSPFGTMVRSLTPCGAIWLLAKATAVMTSSSSTETYRSMPVMLAPHDPPSTWPTSRIAVPAQRQHHRAGREERTHQHEPHGQLDVA